MCQVARDKGSRVLVLKVDSPIFPQQPPGLVFIANLVTFILASIVGKLSKNLAASLAGNVGAQTVTDIIPSASLTV